MKVIKEFLLTHKLSYFIGILFMLATSYIQTLFPKVLGQTIDILTHKGFSFYSVRLNILYIMLIAIGAFITTYIWRNLVIGNARKLECYLREKLFQHFQLLTLEFYNKRKTGDLIAYAINDVSAVRMTFGPATAMTINGIVICLISIYSMTKAINLKMTLLSLIPIPLILFFMINIGKLVQKRFKRVQECFAAISGKVSENINGIRVIKAYVQEEAEVQDFERLNDDMQKANLDMVKISSFLSPLLELCFSVSFVLNLIIGGQMVIDHTISLGDFIAFNGYLTMIMTPVISIGRVITIIQRGMASLIRIDEIMETTAAVKDGTEALDMKIEGSISFKNLSFTYPNANSPSLRNINLNINKGMTVGIVGKTGSGKTTLASLILKQYNVDEENILIDNKKIKYYTMSALREAVGYVPQETFLFQASVSDNIAFFNDSYKKEDIEEAARNSCIYDSIITFPKGFETLLGERGVNLSGGQKQRTTIARAIVKNPPILILDDSLSAVDTVTEAKLLANLRNIRKDKTTLIIAHRLSSVEACDLIIVLDEGKIIERGSHEELLAIGGIYYEIYKEQYKNTNRAS